MELRKLIDDKLIVAIKEIVRKEHGCTLQVLEHLYEIESRKLHLKNGFSSLHEFCVKELGYSDGAAHRRIQSMRLIKNVPESKIKIESGELTLTNAAKFQDFLRNAKKQKIEVPTLELLNNISGCSLRECESQLVKVCPELLPKEKVKIVSDEKVKLEFLMDKQKLEKLKNLMGHKLKMGTLEELFTLLADEKLEKNLASSKKLSRYIPNATKQKVRERCGDRCCFVEPKSRKQCDSRRYLEFDHIKLYSHGGTNQTNNLQLLCSAHNKLRWEEGLRN